MSTRVAPKRGMRTTESASLAWIPDNADHDELAAAARGCHACPLYKHATRVVFGEGPSHAALMLLGEQPGDREDLAGHPFVGPAGRLLDGILEEAGIPREGVYLTNAVKHFKWEPRGERRLHSRPNLGEADACRGWLEAEIELVRPRVIVCLGVLAAQVLCGPKIVVARDRGALRSGLPWVKHVLVTYHPSLLLRRIHDREEYETRRSELLADLVLAARTARVAAFARRQAAHRTGAVVG